MTATTDDFDPVYGVVRMTEHGAKDVMVPWSKMTEAEREQAWAFHRQLYGDESKDSK